MPTPAHPTSWGTTSAIVWTSNADKAGETVTFGTQSGHVISWLQEKVCEPPIIRCELISGQNEWHECYSAQTFEHQEITSLAFDAGSDRLLVAGRGGLIVSLNLGMATPQKIFSILVDFIPVAVAFGGLDGDVRSVLAFDQLGGRMSVCLLHSDID
jgi:hypothetical protein